MKKRKEKLKQYVNERKRRSKRQRRIVSRKVE